MTAEIIIGIGGLALAVLTYFAGVWRTEKRLSKEDREKRVRSVFEKYMDFRSRGKSSGLDGLKRAGASSLSTHDEILEVIDLIINHGEDNPLGRKRLHLFEGVDLKKFFDYATKHRIIFFRTPVEQVIEDSQRNT
jgi:hypothetical protein